MESIQETRPCRLWFVGNWRIAGWSAFTLVTVLLVIILIVILPQVDLLDTAFHNGTAPIVIHSQANARPVFNTLFAVLLMSLLPTGIVRPGGNHSTLGTRTRSAQVLNSSFRC